MAIFHALKRWRHYLLGNKVIIRSDQQSLKYLTSQRLLEGMQHKLMLKLLEFDYNIEYKKGAENCVADALSRKFQDNDPDQCNAISQAIPSWAMDISTSYDNDPACTQLMQALTINNTSCPNFSLDSGIIRYKGRIYVGSSTDLRNNIFQALHASVLGGHSGIRVTYHKIKKLFYRPKLKATVTQLIAHCPICQISKTERVPYPGLLNPLQIPKTKWSEISLDFVEGLPKSKGKDVILVVVDRLTKYAHFIPMSHTYTVKTVADLFFDNIIKLHGPPSSLSVTGIASSPAVYGRKFSLPSRFPLTSALLTIQNLTGKPNRSTSAWSST